MKLKKLFAGIVAVAMMATMAIPGFAAKHDAYDPNDMKDHDSITVTKIYKTAGDTGSAVSPEETFTLAQVGDGKVTQGIADSAPHLGAITGAKFDAGAAKADGTATADITIALPTKAQFGHPGVYEYTLKEVGGTTAGVTYRPESDTFKLVVTVVSNDKGELFRYAAVHTEAATTDAEAENAKKTDTIENTYTAKTLTLEKYTAGNFGDKNEYFQFSLKLTGETGKTYPTDGYAITYPTTEKDSRNTTEKITMGTPVTVWLKSGQKISIANLPEGVTWEAKELTSTGGELTTEAGKTTNGLYTVTVDNASGTVTAFKEGKAVTNEIKFTNTHEGTVDTGVILDNAPYIALLTIVAAGAVVMIIKKRRNYED